MTGWLVVTVVFALYLIWIGFWVWLIVHFDDHRSWSRRVAAGETREQIRQSVTHGMWRPVVLTAVILGPICLGIWLGHG